MNKRVATWAVAAAVLFAVPVCLQAATPVVTIERVTANTADVANESIHWLAPAQGRWYSTKGHAAAYIKGNLFNGCLVTDGDNMTEDYPRSGNFYITEAAGKRQIHLDLLGHNIHQYLIINDHQALRRSAKADYNEMLCGAYLGMTDQEIIHLFGVPDRVAEDQGMERWQYSHPHLSLFVKGGILLAVRAYADSGAYFGKSGLTVTAPCSVFAKTYGWTQVPQRPAAEDIQSPAFSLGKGEFLRFGKEYTELTIFS